MYVSIVIDDMRNIRCKECNKNQPPEEFQWVVRGKSNKPVLNSLVCRTCRRKHEKVLRKLKKENPKPLRWNSKEREWQAACDCCGKFDTKLVCDHDHKTLEFRGWLCNKCNVGIGNLGDDIAGLQNGLRYLKKVRDRLFDEKYRIDESSLKVYDRKTGLEVSLAA